MESDYLEVLTKEEIAEIFDDFPFENYLNSIQDMKIERLRKFESLGLEKVKDLVKREVFLKLINGSAHEVHEILKKDYLAIFNPDELTKIFQKFDFEKIHKCDSDKLVLEIFSHIFEINNSLGKLHLKRKIMEIFSEKSGSIFSVLEGNYLRRFFNYKEQLNLLETMNMELISKKDTLKRFYLLELLNELNSSLFLEPFKYLIRNLIIRKNYPISKYLIKIAYLELFSLSELNEIFQDYEISVLDDQTLKELLNMEIPVINEKYQQEKKYEESPIRKNF